MKKSMAAFACDQAKLARTTIVATATEGTGENAPVKSMVNGKLRNLVSRDGISRLGC